MTLCHQQNAAALNDSIEYDSRFARHCLTKAIWCLDDDPGDVLRAC